jgi:DNA invertase Pin-like site-specific DNA recombinase
MLDVTPHGDPKRTESAGLSLKSLTKAIDINMPSGRLILYVFGALAQYCLNLGFSD